MTDIAAAHGVYLDQQVIPARLAPPGIWPNPLGGFDMGDSTPSRNDHEIPEWCKDRVLVTESGCWEWQGWRNWAGYGGCERFGQRSAHRAVYIDVIGPIPAGLDLDHLCRNRPCCNPAHLEPVTRAENLRRSPLVGRTYGNLSHCCHGHEMTPENTIVDKRRGYRRCRICKLAGLRIINARRKAAR